MELQPYSMARTHRIRALVIRALNLMYEPFVKRSRTNQPVEEGLSSPECLVNRTCIFMWSQGKVGSHYYHFFKFGKLESWKPPIMNSMNEDAFYNRHEDECILKVFCQNFQRFPTDKIMGMTLVNISISVSSNFRYHRLKMQFCRRDTRPSFRDQHRGRHNRDANLLSVVLDPVILVRVIHWWNPQFPDCLNFGSPVVRTLSASNTDSWDDGEDW